jgi:hypothetical protein
MILTFKNTLLSSFFVLKTKLANLVAYGTALGATVTAFIQNYVMDNAFAFGLLAALIMVDTLSGAYRAWHTGADFETRKFSGIMLKLSLLAVVMASITEFAPILILPASIIIAFANIASIVKNLDLAGINVNGMTDVLKRVDSYKNSYTNTKDKPKEQ